MPPREVPVSVVIPCYRCADTVGRALDSVLAQTAQPREVILVDDASGDGTLDALQGLAARHAGPPVVRVLALPENVGAASARNAGWDAAEHDYVAFLDADDSWHPRKLEIQYAVMDRRPQTVVSGHLHLITPGSLDAPLQQDVPRIVSIGFRDLLWSNRFVTSSVMLRRNVGARFPRGQRYMEDHRLWLDIAADGVELLRIEFVLAAHHKEDFGAGGLSGHVWRMEAAELANYANLLRRDKIDAMHYALLIAWSVLKFIRRLLLVLARSAAGRR